MSEDKKQPEQDDPPYISIPMLTREQLQRATDPKRKRKWTPEEDARWAELCREYEEKMAQRRQELEARQSPEEK